MYAIPGEGSAGLLGETRREKVVEGLIESYRTMLQNHRTDAITAHCFRHIKSSKTFEYIKLIKDNCIGMKALGLVNFLLTVMEMSLWRTQSENIDWIG